MKKIILTMLLVGVFATYGYSQASVSHRVIIEIQNKVDIRVKPSTILRTNFLINNSEEQEQGQELIQAGIFQVQATNEWLVQAKPSTPEFSYSGSYAGVTMSTDLLQIKNSKASNFLSLSDEGVVLVNGRSGNFESNEFGIDYKFKPNSIYPPGIYSLDVALTVSNP